MDPSRRTEPQDVRRRVGGADVPVLRPLWRAPGAHAVDVTLHDVAAQRLARSQRQLEVDLVARLEPAERGRRSNVSGTASTRAGPVGEFATVRQTPSTETESPTAAVPASEPGLEYEPSGVVAARRRPARGLALARSQ